MGDKIKSCKYLLHLHPRRPSHTTEMISIRHKILSEASFVSYKVLFDRCKLISAPHLRVPTFFSRTLVSCDVFAPAALHHLRRCRSAPLRRSVSVTTRRRLRHPRHSRYRCRSPALQETVSLAQDKSPTPSNAQSMRDVNRSRTTVTTPRELSKSMRFQHSRKLR